MNYFQPETVSDYSRENIIRWAEEERLAGQVHSRSTGAGRLGEWRLRAGLIFIRLGQRIIGEQVVAP